MIIQDEDGSELSLTKTRLIEKEGSADPQEPWFATMESIRKALANPSRGVIRLETEGYQDGDIPPKPRFANLTFEFENRRIGCRVFAPKVWNKIVKAAQSK